MAYKNNLGKKLEVSKYIGSSRTYRLKYELDYEMGFLQRIKYCFTGKPLNSLNIMSKKEIEDYIDKYYIKANSIKEEYLISDLIACKSYRDSLEFSFRLDEFLLNCIAIFTAIMAIMIAVMLTVANTEINLTVGYSKISGSLISKANKTNTVLNGRIYLVVFVGVIFWFLIKWFSEAIPTNKIRSLNNAIYIIESIKEDIDKNPIAIPETRKFDIEVYNAVDQVSEPIKYSINVNEILEDGINEETNKDTIENKNNPIEIKINL